MSAKIRKGDLVRLNSGATGINDKGNDRGKKEGKVLSVIGGRALVEGCNLVTKHQRPTPKNPQGGGINRKEAPIPVSRLSLMDPKAKIPTRVGWDVKEDGTKVRVARSRRGSSSEIPEAGR